MKSNEALLKRIEEAKKDPAFRVEEAILHFTNQLCEQMEVQELSKAELARRLDKKPSYITRVLSGEVNFTFKTVVAFCMALGAEFKPQITMLNKYVVETPCEEFTNWKKEVPSLKPEFLSVDSDSPKESSELSMHWSSIDMSGIRSAAKKLLEIKKIDLSSIDRNSYEKFREMKTHFCISDDDDVQESPEVERYDQYAEAI